MLKYEVGVAVVVVLRLWNVSQVSCWLHSVWTGVTHKSVTTPKFVTTEGAVASFFFFNPAFVKRARRGACT